MALRAGSKGRLVRPSNQTHEILFRFLHQLLEGHFSRLGTALLPRRWGGERSFGWMSRFRHLARDDDRLNAQNGNYHAFLIPAAIPSSSELLLQKLDAFSGCLYPQPRHTFLPALWETSKQRYS
jgi:hypothetical protein